MSGVRMLHFLKDWWEFIKNHQYYTMALIFFTSRVSMGTTEVSIHTFTKQITKSLMNAE